MAEENVIEPITVTREQFNEYTKQFADNPGGASAVVSKQIMNLLGDTYPNIFKKDTQGNDVDAFKAITNGNSAYFNLSPATANKAPLERSLNYNDIFKLFTVDEDGRYPEDQNFLKGFTRQIIPESFGLSGAYYGAKAGYKLQAPIPPTNPYAVGAKVLIPTATSIAGFFGAYSSSEKALEGIIGKERVVLPEHRADYLSGKTAATGVPWMILPFMVGKDVSLGGATYLSNLAGITSKIGPLTKSDMSKAGVKKAITTGKDPRIARFARGVENFLKNTSELAAKAPKTTLAIEALAVGSATQSRFAAEGYYPGDEVIGTLSEIGGGLTPSLFGAAVVQQFPSIKNAIGNYISKVKSEGFTGFARGAEEKQQLFALEEIRSQLEAEGYTAEDFTALIKKLEDTSFDTELVSPSGDPIKLTAGQKTGDPVLLAMQASLEKTNKATLGKQKKEANTQAMKALRGIILTMANTGDREMIQEASLLAKALFDEGLSGELAIASNRVLLAAERVGAKEGNRTLSLALSNTTENLLEEARSRERQLWNNIETINIKRFQVRQADGSTETSNLPNFILNWQNILPQTQEAAAEFMPKLRNINDFIIRKTEEFGVANLAQPMAESLPEFNKLNKLKDKLVGTYYDEKFKTTLQELDGLSLPEKLSVLRGQVDTFRGKFSTPRGKEYAKVIEAQADFLIAQDKQIKDNLAAGNLGGIPDVSASVSVKEIQEMRSVALNVARTALANNDLQTARMAHAFASDLLADLESFPSGMSAAYDIARQYSRSLNDVFTRAFAGDILDTNKKGASRIAPELLHRKLFTYGDDATYLRIEQLNKMTDFGISEGLEGADSSKASVYGALEGLLRNARREVMNINTGEIDPDRLDNWITQNTGTKGEPKLLDFFPALKTDLDSAVTANNVLKSQIFENKKNLQRLRGQITFMNFLPPEQGGAENPATIIARIMAKRQRAPMLGLDNIRRMLNSAPEDMQELAGQGIRSGILEWAMTLGADQSNTFSARAAFDGLFEKIPGAQSNISLVDWGLKNKIFNEPQVERIKKVLTEMVKIEATAASGVDFDQFIADTGPMLDFYLRVAGSNMGSNIAGMTGTRNNLIAQGAGSKALRRVYSKFFNEIPAAFKGKAIVELFEDPELLAEMLSKPKTDQQAIGLVKRLRNLFGKAGFISPTMGLIRRSAPYTGSAIAEEEDEYVPAPPPNNQTSSNTQPIQTGPPPSNISQVSPSLNPMPNTQPVNRQRFAALFPEDRALIEGIGSLRG